MLTRVSQSERVPFSSHQSATAFMEGGHSEPLPQRETAVPRVFPMTWNYKL